MADGTKIEWADATLNYVNGCSLASPGCTNCYAMKQAHRFDVRRGLTQMTKGGMVWTGEIRLNDKALQQALAWKRGRRIFWNAHGDLFHENVPDAAIDRLFAVCALTPQHTHMILTKRSARMREYLTKLSTIWHDAGDPFDDRIGSLLVELSGSPCAIGVWEDQFILPNVWLGVSVEDQQRADERIPDLLNTPAAVRFISAEPLLGPVDLGAVRWDVAGYPMLGALPNPAEADDFRWAHHDTQGIRWVIIGGESGPNARPMHPDWARSLRDQCQAAGVPLLFKQWGEWEVSLDRERDDPDWRANYTNDYVDHGKSKWLNLAGGSGFHGERFLVMRRVGKKAAGRLLDGREWSEFPGHG